MSMSSRTPERRMRKRFAWRRWVWRNAEPSRYGDRNQGCILIPVGYVPFDREMCRAMMKWKSPRRDPRSLRGAEARAKWRIPGGGRPRVCGIRDHRQRRCRRLLCAGRDRSRPSGRNRFYRQGLYEHVSGCPVRLRHGGRRGAHAFGRGLRNGACPGTRAWLRCGSCPAV